MTNKDVKKLTVSALKKQGKKFDEKGEMSVTIGGVDYVLNYDLYFRKTKIYALLEDLLDFFQEADNSGRIELFNLATPYTSLLILKHFTSLDVPDDIDEALAILDLLIDYEILDKLLASLPEDELTKTYEILTESIDNIRIQFEEVIESEDRQEVEELSDNDDNK